MKQIGGCLYLMNFAGQFAEDQFKRAIVATAVPADRKCRSMTGCLDTIESLPWFLLDSSVSLFKVAMAFPKQFIAAGHFPAMVR